MGGKAGNAVNNLRTMKVVYWIKAVIEKSNLFQIVSTNQFVLLDCDKLKQVSTVVNNHGDDQSVV